MRSQTPTTIECRVGAWYYKRMGLMATMLAVFGAWFLYDGLVGYAKKNRAAMAEEAFKAAGGGATWDQFAATKAYVDMSPGPDVVEFLQSAYAAGKETMPWGDYALKQQIAVEPAQGSDEAAIRAAFEAGKKPGGKWEDFAREGGMPVDPTDERGIALKRAFEGAGQKREFAGFAASLGLSSVENKYHSRKDIVEQLVIGGLCLAGAGLAILLLVFNRNRMLRADDEAVILPDGTRVPFAAAFRLDLRKWDNKGLAYVHYRDNGVEKKAVLDDLKFIGADKVLERLKANFHGELVDRATDGGAPVADPVPSPPSGHVSEPSARASEHGEYDEDAR